MATNIVKAPLFRITCKRGYSQVVPLGGIPNYEVRSTQLANKLVVASAENESPISRVSVVVRSGSRNETPDSTGVTHVLRVSAGLSTQNISQFLITRNIQQLGASLTATSDREVIAYTLEGTRDAVQEALPFLNEVASQQVFKPWEVSELDSRLKLDLATRPLQLRAVDLLHKAAFRRGLGNSLFVPKHQIGKISTETLQDYVARNFTTGRTAVVGIGVGHDSLLNFAQGLKLESGDGINSPSPYRGGELRSDKGGDIAFVAVGTEGASLKDTKLALSFGVLQKIVGTGPQIKWSTLDRGLFNKVAAQSGVEQYAASAINANYSDSGLFGILLAVPSEHAGKLVCRAVNFLRNVEITDEDVARGKTQLISSILINSESGSNAIGKMGLQAALTGKASTPCESVNIVQSLNKNDILQALSKVTQSKLSIASVGELSCVPYLDEIE